MEVTDNLYLKVAIPSMKGFKTKKFETNMQIKNIIESINKTLPPKSQSDLYALYFGDTVELKREPKYQFSLLKSQWKRTLPRAPSFGSAAAAAALQNKYSDKLFIESNIKTSEAVKKIGDWATSSVCSLKSSPEEVGSYRLSKKVITGIKQELGDLKDFSSYSLKTNDVLELEVSSSKGVSVVEILIDYSPIVENTEKTRFDNKEVLEPQPSKKYASKNQYLSKFRRLGGRERESSQQINDDISMPYNVVHKLHVDWNFQWSGEKPDDLFELKERIGEGAFGNVWLATHKETGYALAIKQVAVHSHGKKAIEKEIDVLKKCKSPNILSYYGCVSNANQVWILMDYCAVGSVKDLINLTLEPLDEPQLAEVCLGVVRGLSYLHARGIIHLDIKAGNIMLTEDGDFGVSESLRRETILNNRKPNNMVGSPLFMAPEVIKQEPYDSKADIWSLGITLVELAEGRPPNNDITNMEMLKQLPERPPPTLQRPHHFSKECNEFLATCCTKDPKLRPDAISLLQHPFVVRAQGPEVLRMIIKSYLELKAEQQNDELQFMTKTM